MSSYRPRYHVTPPQGRLNDPNGVYVDGDTLHVYYQHDPGFPEAPKRTGWGHTATQLSGPDALIWRHYPDALYPDVSYDRNGCFSGSAVVREGDVRLYYTGNVKEDGKRSATQNLVTVANPGGPEGGAHQRSDKNPLIDGPSNGFTAHYRDPQITVDPESPGAWRMVIGAQREDETGAVVLYRSTDLDNWEFAGELQFNVEGAEPGLSPDLVPGGYMWECPNLVTMTDDETGERLDVLIYCPQGLAPVETDGKTHYGSSDQCGYVVGRLRGTNFEVVRGFSELDYGHEFYAPQVAAGGAPDQVLMVGWMGLPAQDDQPSLSAEGWVHCLTAPRRLSLRGHRLYQDLMLPEQEAAVSSDGFYGGSVVHRRELSGDPLSMDLTGSAQSDDGPVVSLNWDPVTDREHGRLTVTRGDDSRVVACPAGELVVFVDGSAVEITAGSGAVAFSLRAFYGGDPVLTSA